MTRDELLDLITPVCAFVASKTSSIATFQQLCFKGSLVIGYNGECGYIVRGPLNLTCAVSADKFLSIVKKLPHEDVSLSLQKDSLRIKCKGTTATLPTQNAENYPDPLSSSFQTIGAVADLPEALEFCSKLIDTTARNQFCGVAVSGKYAYSTDGLRATRYELESSMDGGLLFFPLKAAKSLIKLPAPSRYVAWNNLVGAMFDSPPGLWYSLLLSGKFPASAIDSMFDDDVGSRVLIDLPEGMYGALERLQLVTDESTDGVQLVSNGSEMQLLAVSRVSGEIIETLPYSSPHQFSIKFNPNHFLDALNVSSKVDISGVLQGKRQTVRFFGEKVSHLMSLHS